MKQLSLAVVTTLTLTLAACGGSDNPPAEEPRASTTTTSTPTPSPSPSEEPGVVVEVTIAGGKVTPTGDRVEVEVGEEVTLRVSSDVVEELHVHSDPEEFFKVKKADDQEFTLTIDRPGQVAIETHESGVTIVQLVVT